MSGPLIEISNSTGTSTIVFHRFDPDFDTVFGVASRISRCVHPVDQSGVGVLPFGALFDDDWEEILTERNRESELGSFHWKTSVILSSRLLNVSVPIIFSRHIVKRHQKYAPNQATNEGFSIKATTEFGYLSP